MATEQLLSLGVSQTEVTLRAAEPPDRYRRAPYCEPPVISHLLSLSLTAQHLR